MGSTRVIPAERGDLVGDGLLHCTIHKREEIDTAMMSAGDWDARYRDAELLWTAEPNRFVAAELDGIAPGRALDVAAGEGRNAVWLAERGWTVTAVDFSPVALDKGRALARARGVEVHWLVEDVTVWQPAPAAFDAVVVAYLHLPATPLARAMRAAAGAVAPGGLLVAVGHDRDNAGHGYGGPPDPSILWDAGTLVQWLPGLVVERADQVTREVDTEEGARTAIDSLVRCRREPGPALAAPA
ncbi:MAG: class I SAM-dependent methyltransferase [Egibacteraceae bacterium]